MSTSRNTSSNSASSISCNSLLLEYEVVEQIENLNLKKADSNVASKFLKAKRIKFYHNGNKFFAGVIVPVTQERYRSFDSLTSELTTILTKSVVLPSGVRHIYNMEGKKILFVEDFEDGKSYVCSGKGEVFKKIDYSVIGNLKTKKADQKKNERLSSQPLLDCVYPRIVFIIRNGIKPRKILRLLLNKRNSASYEQVLSAMTQVAQLDTGAVRKVFTKSGKPVTDLSHFFSTEDAFFVCGSERFNQKVFDLDIEENKAIEQHRKGLVSRSSNTIKPKLAKNEFNCTFGSNNGVQISEIRDDFLPPHVKSKYMLGQRIGDGNFAVVNLCIDKIDRKEYALKIIDKSKCKEKGDMIENEVNILKSVSHPNIMALIADESTKTHLFLVCEYVKGGDLFDAISSVQKFSEEEAALMINHLCSALSYLHNLEIVHRDVKPENLLVEYKDSKIKHLKLGDFGLACKVTQPLYAVCGTPTYVAPEILAETGYDLKIDIWAAGVILYILLCGYPPFVNEQNDQEKLFDSILSGRYEFLELYWCDISLLAKELIQNMLQLEPELRFSAEDVLDHHWIHLFKNSMTID